MLSRHSLCIAPILSMSVPRTKDYGSGHLLFIMFTKHVLILEMLQAYANLLSYIYVFNYYK